MKFKCVYCEKSTIKFTRDHLIPLSRRSVVNMTVQVCSSCNAFKNDDMPDIFVGRLETILRNFKNIVNKAKEQVNYEKTFTT